MNIKQTSFMNSQTNFNQSHTVFEDYENSSFRPSDDSMINYINYKTFEELEPPSRLTDTCRYCEETREELESTDWIIQFYAIDKLRSLNKYNPTEGNELFNFFGA